MRRTIPIVIPSKAGDRKTLKFFAWRPIQIGQDWRWLERVTVIYEFVCSSVWNDGDHWRALKFED